jgi:hypothetical protein
MDPIKVGVPVIGVLVMAAVSVEDAVLVEIAALEGVSVLEWAGVVVTLEALALSAGLGLGRLSGSDSKSAAEFSTAER